MKKYIIYENGFEEVHLLKLACVRDGVPVYEHYLYIKEGVSAAQSLVKELEEVDPTLRKAGFTIGGETAHPYSDRCTCRLCIETWNRTLANKILASVKRKKQ